MKRTLSLNSARSCGRPAASWIDRCAKLQRGRGPCGGLRRRPRSCRQVPSAPKRGGGMGQRDSRYNRAGLLITHCNCLTYPELWIYFSTASLSTCRELRSVAHRNLLRCLRPRITRSPGLSASRHELERKGYVHAKSKCCFDRGLQDASDAETAGASASRGFRATSCDWSAEGCCETVEGLVLRLRCAGGAEVESTLLTPFSIDAASMKPD